MWEVGAMERDPRAARTSQFVVNGGTAIVPNFYETDGTNAAHGTHEADEAHGTDETGKTLVAEVAGRFAQLGGWAE